MSWPRDRNHGDPSWPNRPWRTHVPDGSRGGWSPKGPRRPGPGGPGFGENAATVVCACSTNGVTFSGSDVAFHGFKF
jgi:hypothetical protein